MTFWYLPNNWSYFIQNRCDVYIHTLWRCAAWSSRIPPANVTSWDTLHCLLNIFKKTVWIVNVCSTQNNPNTKVVFIQLMNSKWFLVRSSTNHKHNDILWPVITAWLLKCTISQTELVHKQKFFKGSFTTPHIYMDNEALGRIRLGILTSKHYYQTSITGPP